MNLIDHENCSPGGSVSQRYGHPPPRQLERILRLLEHKPHVSSPRARRRQLLEVGIGRARNEARQRRLPAPRWAPEDTAADTLACFYARAQEAPGAYEVGLPDIRVERGGAGAFGQSG
jgi:hypothetical protein